ncbi:hypothetical protein Tco_0291944 [Tanacetum coccineum]
MLRSGEDRLSLKELMDLCTKLSNRVLDLETTKTSQAKEIARLKKRVKKLERKRKSKTPGMKRLFKNQEDASKQGRKIADLDADVEEVEVEKVIVQEPVQSTTTTAPSAIPRAKGILFHEQEQAPTPIVSSQQPKQVKDKDVDMLLAERLQTREQEELKDEQKERLFVELLEKRKKHFAALRAQEKKNKPPTKAQKKSTMVNMFVDKDTTELVKESSKKAEAEMAEESNSKRAGDELEQEPTKKQKVDDDKEREDLQQCFEKGRNGYYEIMRADGSAKTYVLFSQLLKEFDREDLENLWKLLKQSMGIQG